uniref:BZIP domain-containing protein n=1 Tax=Arion vulgaris TaxID=1028688 RepID=A0A0B7B045_9EUPU
METYDDTLSKIITPSSSLDDLNVLEPDQYEDITNVIPNVLFDGGDLLVIQTSDNNDDVDFSDYLPGISDVSEEFSILEQASTSLNDFESTSSTQSISNSTFPVINPGLSYESSSSENCVWVIAPSVTETSQSIISDVIKQEIRCKIQLKRINQGQEELKADFTQPDTTISYTDVQKRNEIREKNKQYARQSRDRVKHEWKRLEETNRELVQLNVEVRNKLKKLREKFRMTNDLLQYHHRECSICSKPGGVCSICSTATVMNSCPNCKMSVFSKQHASRNVFNINDSQK